MSSSVEQQIATRIAGIRQRISRACERSGRDPSEISLLGVSKRQPLTRVRAAIAAGLRVLGENQIQEAVEKSAQLPVDLDWHFVGHLQSNKVKAAVRLFGTIHSIDRLKIARRIDLEAQRQNKRLAGLVQVNLGAEPNKYGYPADALIDELRPLTDLENLRIVGLMAIPPYEEAPEAARGWFTRLRELRDEIALRPEWHEFPGWLSMGMSHDFEAAIEEGATHVRVGTSIFGSRPT